MSDCRLPQCVFIHRRGMSCVVLILLIINGIAHHDCARILAVFPALSISHQVPFRPITQELARRGHEVTVITPDPAFPKGKAPANLTEIDIHEISYAYKDSIFAIAASNTKSHTEQVYHVLLQVFDTQLQDAEVKKAIHPKNKYDLLLLEACFRNTLALSHVFKVPVIRISSFGAMAENNFVMGSVGHPILYPTILYQRKVHNHSIWDKIQAVYAEFVSQGIVSRYEELENQMLKKHFGEDLPSLNKLSNNVDMLFLNVHPIWENNRPVPPNVIYLGGLPQKPSKELPQDLKAYLDSSKNGVIYISFGTNVNPSLLPVEKIQIFLKVLSHLPYDVLWKWDQDELTGKPDNVRIEKWFPQSDLLKHPKIKLFIMQGGLQSTDEALIGGVPLLCIPMLFDQWFNADIFVKYNIGKKLELEEIEEGNLVDAIKSIIEDTSYRKNVVNLHSIMSNQPNTALERAIFWTEYVIKHGGARHLRAPGANMAWREYYELDLVLTLLFIVTLITVILVLVMLKCLKILLSGKKVKIH